MRSRATVREWKIVGADFDRKVPSLAGRVWASPARSGVQARRWPVRGPSRPPRLWRRRCRVKLHASRGRLWGIGSGVVGLLVWWSGAHAPTKQCPRSSATALRRWPCWCERHSRSRTGIAPTRQAGEQRERGGARSSSGVLVAKVQSPVISRLASFSARLRGRPCLHRGNRRAARCPRPDGAGKRLMAAASTSRRLRRRRPSCGYSKTTNKPALVRGHRLAPDGAAVVDTTAYISTDSVAALLVHCALKRSGEPRRKRRGGRGGVKTRTSAIDGAPIRPGFPQKPSICVNPRDYTSPEC